MTAKRYEELKVQVKNGTIAYDEITELQRRNVINKGQALSLRRLWNKAWKR